MKRLLLTIATLFMVSELFSQTWDVEAGTWFAPVNKNAGVPMSFQMGDHVGNDTLIQALDAWVSEVTTGSVVYNTFQFNMANKDATFTAYYFPTSDTLISWALNKTGINGVWQYGSRYKYQFGIWDSTTGGAGFPYVEMSLNDTLLGIDWSRFRIDRTFNLTIAHHDTIQFQIDTSHNVYIGQDSNISVIKNTAIIQFGAKGRSQGITRYMEDDDNGGNYSEIRCASSLASNTLFQVPTSNGTSGYVLQTDGTGITSWVAQSGSGLPSVDTTVNYNDTVSVSSSKHVSVNGAGTGVTKINLWAAPLNSWVIISDTDNKAAANNIVIDAGTGKDISAVSTAQTYTITTDGSSISLQKVSNTTWKIF